MFFSLHKNPTSFEEKLQGASRISLLTGGGSEVRNRFRLFVLHAEFAEAGARLFSGVGGFG